MRIDHIAIAVNNTETALENYKKILNIDKIEIEEVPNEKVKVLIMNLQDTRIELLEPMNNDSPISRFLKERGEGIHHIAFEVEDIYGEIERLKKEGFELLNEEPKQGADNKLICFLNPKNSNGILIELCQEKKIESGISPEMIPT